MFGNFCRAEAARGQAASRPAERRCRSTPPTPPPGSIDFKVTDFDDARRSIDELPAGVAELNRLMHGYDWALQWRKPLPTDWAITCAALDWVIGLPPAVRPHAARKRFPRVVNAIPETWTGVHYGLRIIDHMIRDDRGGRRCFQAAVKIELDAV